MKIEYSREKIMGLFLRGRKKVFSIGIIVSTLILTLIISRAQTKKIESLHVNKDTELKKNDVLSEISRSEKTINLYKKLFSKKDASSVTNAVSNIARDSNLIVISINQDKEESELLYTKYSFTLVIGADSYHAIGKFIDKIENQAEAYFVDAISIRSQEESRTPDTELSGASKPANKLIVNVTLSIIVFKG